VSEWVKLWSCPDCAFSFDKIHEDEGGGYTCPLCEVGRLRKTLDAAQTVINDLSTVIGLCAQIHCTEKLFGSCGKCVACRCKVYERLRAQFDESASIVAELTNQSTDEDRDRLALAVIERADEIARLVPENARLRAENKGLVYLANMVVDCDACPDCSEAAFDALNLGEPHAPEPPPPENGPRNDAE